MGLFDKIKDNARDISKRTLEEPDADFALPEQATPDQEDSADIPQGVIEPSSEPDGAAAEESTEQPEPDKAEKDETADTKPEADPEPKPASKPKEDKPKTKESEKVTVTTGSRQPYYKSAEKIDDKSKTDAAKKSASRRSTAVIDITPQKIQDPVKREIYARERAAMSALASQRKLNGQVPLYVTSHLSFKTRVFINRIEYSGSFGKNVLPIETVAWVKLRSGGTGIIIETTDSKRVVMVVKPKDRLAFADAIMKVQEMQPKRVKFKDTKTVRIDQLEQFTDDYDELEKLARLHEKGIVSREEFETKKKQILGI